MNNRQKQAGTGLLLFIFLLSACTTIEPAQKQEHKVKEKDEDKVTVADIHNSRISLDWDGTYSGTIPAADGPGIIVHITLNPDYTYALSYRYADRETEEIFVRGTFNWNEAGSIITLNINFVPPYYKVGENILTQLDMLGNEISGTLAEHYILRKVR